jgi:uncharacterized protein (TIGR03435 family)
MTSWRKKRLSFLYFWGVINGFFLVGYLSTGPIASLYAQNESGIQANDGSTLSNTRTSITRFAVASVRPDDRNDGKWRADFESDGYVARGVTVFQLLQDAFGLFEDGRIFGLPKWAETQVFDVNAKVDEDEQIQYKRLGLEDRRLLLQALLAERFKLITHRELRERPVYVLVLAKSGPRLHESIINLHPSVAGMGGTITRGKPGQLTVEWEDMDYFARYLSGVVDRHVVNQTGLNGHYDFSLDWKPDAGSGGASSIIVDDSAGPSIFTALREQLGLELKAAKGGIETLVVDHVERPSAN